MRLRKALYGLRVAAQTWSRHLAKLLKKLCDLEPCETEACLFAGTVLGGQRVVVLCYVDDLLITGESDEAIYHVVEQLKTAVKVKVTADLDRDGQITFLGRQIARESSSDSLCVTMSDSYYEEIYKGSLETLRSQRARRRRTSRSSMTKKTPLWKSPYRLKLLRGFAVPLGGYHGLL